MKLQKDIFKELTGYASLVKRMQMDNRLLPTHLSLFTGLFVCWQRNGFTSPFGVTRKELMAYSKVESIARITKVSKSSMNTVTSRMNRPTIPNSAAKFTGPRVGRYKTILCIDTFDNSTANAMLIL